MDKIKKLINREFILYAIFGVLTSILNVVLFYILDKFLVYILANIITLIIVKLTSYITSKLFVFKSKCKNKKELVKEFTSFMFFRILTMIIDFIGLIFLVELIHIDKLISKIIVTIVVIIINFIISKKVVFKSKNS